MTGADRDAARRIPGLRIGAASLLCLLAITVGIPDARAQSVEDGSGAALGPVDTRKVLDLVAHNLKSPDAKVTALRRSTGATVCGSVNVKNRDGLYLGERGFIVDLSTSSFGRVPDGPELLTFRKDDAYEAMERIRQRYFAACLD